MRRICDAGVAAALGAGASYADARAVVRRSQALAVKNGRVEAIDDVETEGVGVRVLVAGAWGFACSRRLDEAGAQEAALRAAAFARAAGGRGAKALAPVGTTSGSYRTPVELDPFAVSLEQKLALALAAEAALHEPGVTVGEAFLRARRELRTLVSSDGVSVEQELVECGGGVDATATDERHAQTRSYPSAHTGSSAQAGWEAVLALGLEREAPRVGEQAAALLRADPCPARTTTVVIDAEQMQLQVHESVGHPTELDRVLGSEASYAGTSFLAPGDLGSLRYGSPLMNVTADPTTPAGSGASAGTTRGCPPRRGRWCARASSSAGSARARPGIPARCAPTAGRGCRSCG